MEKLAKVDNPLISELQQTILSLRELLEQSTHGNEKKTNQLIEQHQESEERLKQTVIKLREQVTSLQFRNDELAIKFNHDITAFHKEKLNTDKHYQTHLLQVRSEFEQTIQKLQTSNQQQIKIQQSEVIELQTQVKKLRSQMTQLPDQGTE